MNKENLFPVKIWNEKVVPVNIATVISNLKELFLREKRLLILDKVTFNELIGYMQNRENFYYKTPISTT